MSISGWLLGHQSGVFDGQPKVDTCPKNMQKLQTVRGAGSSCLFFLAGRWRFFLGCRRGCFFLEVVAFREGCRDLLSERALVWFFWVLGSRPAAGEVVWAAIRDFFERVRCFSEEKERAARRGS